MLICTGCIRRLYAKLPPDIHNRTILTNDPWFTNKKQIILRDFLGSSQIQITKKVIDILFRTECGTSDVLDRTSRGVLFPKTVGSHFLKHLQEWPN